MFFIPFFFFVVPLMIVGFTVAATTAVNKASREQQGNNYYTSGTTVYVPIHKIEQRYTPAHGNTYQQHTVLSYVINNVLYSEIVQVHEIAHLREGQIIPVTYSGEYAKAYLANPHQQYGGYSQHSAPQPPQIYYDHQQNFPQQSEENRNYEAGHFNYSQNTQHQNEVYPSQHGIPPQQPQDTAQQPQQSNHEDKSDSTPKVSQIDADRIMDEILTNDPTHMKEIPVKKNNNKRAQ